jgi:uncharacterized protein YciW
MSTTHATRTTTEDAINSILGTSLNDTISQLRNHKPELVKQDQDYYLAIFEPNPNSAAAFSLVDRALIAIRVASHTRSQSVIDWYSALAEENGATSATIARIRDVATPWDDETTLGAAVRHADVVTTAPAETRASNLQALKDAGYTPAGILSLAQTIAFVSYQLRLIAGLRVLGTSGVRS